MVTSSVTSSPPTPAWSGHFTLLSGADRSCAPYSLDCVPLTAMRLSPTIRARRGPRKDSFSATELGGGEERRGRKFRPLGEIKTDAEINPVQGRLRRSLLATWRPNDWSGDRVPPFVRGGSDKIEHRGNGKGAQP